MIFRQVLGLVLLLSCIPLARTSSSSCCATRSQSCAAPTRGHAWTGRTEPCSPRSSDGCLEHCEPIVWSGRTRSWAGIAALCADDGPTPNGPDGHRSTTASPTWWCRWRGRTRDGGMRGSRVSCSSSATVSALRRSVASSSVTGSGWPRCGAPTPVGGSSCAPRRPACSRSTSSTSTVRSPCGASMSCSCSRSATATYTSWA
jgi:hypothetical protein